MLDSAKIVGGNGKRHANDFYPTPPDVTIALCKYLWPNGAHRPVRIWEPACGDGAMVDALCAYGHDAYGTDIQTGTDFLTADMPENTELIITNPPFSLAEQFIRRANEMGVPFAFLLKCQYWHSAKRKKLWDEITPSEILPLTWRPDFTGQGASLMDMMWVVWHRRFWPNGITAYQPLERPKGCEHLQERVERLEEERGGELHGVLGG